MQTRVAGVSFWIDPDVPNLLHYRSVDGERTGHKYLPADRITSIKPHDRYPNTLVIRVGYPAFWWIIDNPKMEFKEGLVIYMPGDKVYETSKEKKQQEEQ